MKSAIRIAWEHGGPEFQSRFDKSTAQAELMKARGDSRPMITQPRWVDIVDSVMTVIIVMTVAVLVYVAFGGWFSTGE